MHCFVKFQRCRESDIFISLITGETRTAQLKLVNQQLRVSDPTDTVLEYLSDTLRESMTEILLRGGNFSDFKTLQGDIVRSSNWLTSSATSSPVATVPDSTGGFVLPLRNRFVMNGKIGGYTLSFCAIARVDQYAPFAARNVWPIYSTAAAALQDTAYVGGTQPAPYRMTGQLSAGSTFIDYFVPAVPMSTGGLICAPPAYRAAWGSDPQASTTVFGARFGDSSGAGLDDSKCKSLIDEYAATASSPPPQTAGRRSLMQATRFTVSVAEQDKTPAINIRTGASVRILPQRFDATSSDATPRALTESSPPGQAPPPEKVNTGMIVGIVAGSAALVLVGMAGYVIFARRRGKGAESAPAASVGYRYPYGGGR